MSLGKVMTLAAMLAGDADPEALNQEEFKLVQEELKTYSIEVETQKDLASVLGALDLGEGKKVDLSSLPMYASNGMVYSDAGGEVMSKDQIQSIVEVLLSTPNFRYLGWNKPKSIAKKIDKIPEDKLAVCSAKYWETISGGNFSDVEKAQVMVAVLNLYGYEKLAIAESFITGNHKAIPLGDISKKVPNLMVGINGMNATVEKQQDQSRKLDDQSRKLDEQSRKLDEQARKLDEQAKQLNQKLSKLKKNNKELKKTADYMNKLVDYLIGKRSLLDRDVQKMVDYVDETLKKVGEYDKDWETIRKQVLIKKDK